MVDEMDVDIFYNSDGVLNRNKLKEKWVEKNLPDLYSKVIIFNLPEEIILFSQKLYHYVNNMDVHPACSNCGGVNKRWQSFSSGYKLGCDKHCAISITRPNSNKTRERNTIEKYGVKHTSQLEEVKCKVKKTNELRYGGVAPACDLEVLSKIKETNKKLYGVEFPLQNEFIMDKFKNSCLTLYGVDNPSKNKDVVDKRINNIINNSIEVIKKEYNLDVLGYKGGEFYIKCDICNLEYSTNRSLLRSRVKEYSTNPCVKCNPVYSFSSSNYEDELVEYLDGFGVNIIRNHRINNKEMDVYLPEYNLGIEINGLYWHSELNKTKNYHIEKTNFFKSKDIQILHVWEDDWLYKRDIVKSVLKNKLKFNDNKIYARKCDVRVLSNKECKPFLLDNHIQGYTNSKVCLALFYNDDLVSLMTFSDKRHIKNDSWEIVRFCNMKGVSIVGGASKLFKYFIKNYEIDSVISYAKYDYTDIDNNVYLNMGFKFDKLTTPGYYWCKNTKRYNRYNFRKDKLVKEGFDKSKTEVEIMHDRGYYKIWDSGNLKFKWNRDDRL